MKDERSDGLFGACPAPVAQVGAAALLGGPANNNNNNNNGGDFCLPVPCLNLT